MKKLSFQLLSPHKFARTFAGVAAIVCLPFAASAQSGPVSLSTSNFIALVNQGFNNFKSGNAPSTLPAYDGKILVRTKHDGLAMSKIKVFLPPGTLSFAMTYTSYRTPEPGQMSMRFSAVPQTRAIDVFDSSMNDTRESLAELVKGRELTFYSPGNSGVISGPTAPQVPVRIQSGGYVYIDVSHPGGSAISIAFRTDVDQQCYSSWYANAKWDANGNPLEGASHTCAGTGASNLNTTVTPPLQNQQPDGTFSLEASNARVLRGQQVKITALPTTTMLTTCTGASNGQPSEPVSFQVVQSGLGMKVASAVVPANLTGTKVTVTCTSDKGKSAAKVVDLIETVPPPPVEQGAIEGAEVTVSATSASAQSPINLSTTIKPPLSQVGKRFSVWIGAEAMPLGATSPLYFLIDAKGALNEFTSNSLLSESNAAAVQVSAVPAGVKARVFDAGLLQASVAQLGQLRVRIFGAYSFDGGVPTLIDHPLFDCSSGTCQ